MKFNIVFISCLLFSTLLSFSQVEVQKGPALENDRDSKMNRMLGGDETSFFCYRVRSRGKGTSFFVEKYDKQTLKPVFSKEISVEDAEDTKIVDVKYANNKVYIFRRFYDKKTDKMTLYYQTVSSSGDVADKLVSILTTTSDHYEFIDFEVFLNPSMTKFLVKSCHKPNKDGVYTTDFVAFDVKTMNKEWQKTAKQKLFNRSYDMASHALAVFGGVGVNIKDATFIGLFFDDNDNIYFGYTEKVSKEEKRYKLMLGIMKSEDNTPEKINLPFDDEYKVGDIEFAKSNNNEIIIGGFLQDVIERKGRDIVKAGIFSFAVDMKTNNINSKTIKMFDDKLLLSLESSVKRANKFQYKLDHIISVGEDVFYIGEQYDEDMVQTRNQYGQVTSTRWQYEYMDVIVAKLNKDGQFEWIKNAPVRNKITLNSPHVFKQYIAYPTENNIYIMYNEHPKNMAIYAKPDYEPRDLKATSSIHGSVFVYAAISTSNGNMKRGVIFENEEYCFAPIQERNPQFYPPEEAEIFVQGNNNLIYIYTEDRGADQFAKIKFE